MLNISNITEAADLIGDPARANILFALKDDSEIASGALADVAGVAPSTASEHLARLLGAGLVRMRIAGRRRYYSLAGPSVAEMLEGFELIAANLSLGFSVPARHDPANLHARCCYDHLAGRVGVRISQALFDREFLRHTHEGPEITGAGAAWLGDMQLDLDGLRRQPRRFLRLCPDWSESGMHMGGAVGAALFQAMSGQGWLRRMPRSTTVQVTPKGVAKLRSALNIHIPRFPAGSAQSR